MIDTNNKGLIYMTRAVLRGMVEQPIAVISLTISSTAAGWPYAGSQRVYMARRKPLCAPV